MISNYVTPTTKHREIWRRKPILRTIYGDYYRRILGHCTKGSIVEIGSGTGNFKDYCPQAISTDIQAVNWIDLVLEAHQLPFGNQVIDNIVMIDTLHHLQVPVLFFNEVKRVLTPGGRLIMVEPEISPVSYLFYKFMHPEPVVMNEFPLSDRTFEPHRDPFESNQAIPHLLLTKYRNDFETKFKNLKIIKYQRFSCFSYVLSGGFRNWCLLPFTMAPAVLKLENFITPIIAPIAAFRLLAVIEKQKN